MLEGREQLQAIWHLGEFIGRRSEGKYCVTLFQIGSFYVELFYHASTNEFIELRSFVSTDQLLPYLNTVDLSSFQQSR
jgi:hypothetical protein